VQPHVLKDRGVVRLRRVIGAFDESLSSPQMGVTSSSSGQEIRVSVEQLSSTIRAENKIGRNDVATSPASSRTGNTGVASNPQSRERSTSKRNLQCILIENDSYFGNDRDVTRSETPHWRNYLKLMKKVALTCEARLSSTFLRESSADMAELPVFAVMDMTYISLRDFGTSLISNERSVDWIQMTIHDMIERYPKFKRSLRTLGLAIENHWKRHVWESTTNSKRAVTIVLYSQVDDRFDVVSLQSNSGTTPTSHPVANARQRAVGHKRR
jgi:hypothetical protein